MATLIVATNGLVMLLLMAALFLLHRRGKRIVSLQAQTREAVGQLAELSDRAFSLLAAELQGLRANLGPVNSISASNALLDLHTRSRVITLAAHGMGVEEIAEKLNISRGEAELIIKLNSYSLGEGKGSR